MLAALSILAADMTPAQNASQPSSTLKPERVEHLLRWIFGFVLLARLLYPFFNSPLDHLGSDPLMHWQNGQHLFDPNLMGSIDPYLYQVVMHLIQALPGPTGATVSAAIGVLCAAMPYGWYRAFKELLPRSWALGGAIVMGVIPAFLGIYAFFMNETLLLTLTGFAFWGTFRAHRKRTIEAFTVACVLWLLAGFTRNTALPAGLVCLLSIWLPQPAKLVKAVIGLVVLCALAIPAGMHARVNLNYFAPFGGTDLTSIYNHSGNTAISIHTTYAVNNASPVQWGYWFSSPSFNNQTFYPFSDWVTDRSGTADIKIDVNQGRRAWLQENARVSAARTMSMWAITWENFLYLTFGQSWPDNDLNTVLGWLTVWMRWLWPVLIVVIAVSAALRRYRGREWLLPVCGLGLFALLAVQQAGVMEGRYRKPIDPIFVAAAVVLVYRRRQAEAGKA